MDLLGILIVLGIVLSSIKGSQNAKEQSKSRKAQEQERTEAPKAKTQTNRYPAQTTSEDDIDMDLEAVVGQMVDKVKGVLNLENEEVAKPKKKKPAQPKNSAQPKQQKVASTAHKPGKRRNEHERLQPSVKPIKSVFEEKDDCGQRIELNPHIPYGQAEPKPKQKRPTVTVRYDEETILQSIIWAEILSKPKALENWARYAPKQN